MSQSNPSFFEYENRLTTNNIPNPFDRSSKGPSRHLLHGAPSRTSIFYEDYADEQLSSATDFSASMDEDSISEEQPGEIGRLKTRKKSYFKMALDILKK